MLFSESELKRACERPFESQWLSLLQGNWRPLGATGANA
jgi:hypothetical protein